MSDADLTIIPSEDLLEELLTRFDHGVFAGVRVRTTNGDVLDTGDIETIRRWKGNSYTVAGIAQSLSHVVLDDFEDRCDPKDGIE